jgi:GntR family transcriptional regulator
VEFLEIDMQSSVPIWLQLRNRIIYLISSGAYKPGHKLPTVRELAIKLKINYNTVNKVYQSLLHDGYIMSHRGRGTFVHDISHPDIPKQDSPADNIIDLMIKQCLGVGVPLDDITNQVSKRVQRLRDSAASADSGLENESREDTQECEE